MSSKLFNRIVMIVVIVALLVIFIPMLFSERTKPTRLAITAIPAMPSLPKTTFQTILAAKQVGQADQGLAASALPKPLSISEQETVEKVLTGKQALRGAIKSNAMNDAAARLAAAQAKNQAWVVHLTGLADARAVAASVKQLQAIGLPAYTYSESGSESGKGDFYINIGPFTHKDEAIKDLKQAKQQLKLKGEVIVFNPRELN